MASEQEVKAGVFMLFMNAAVSRVLISLTHVGGV